MPDRVVTHRPGTAGRAVGAGARLWRAALIVQLILLAAEFVAGMAANLYARVPAVHPGSVRPGTDYFTDLARAERWVLGSGPPALPVHVVLSLLIGVAAIGLVVVAVRAGGRGRAVVAWAGLALIVGAGFNGGSFLVFGDGDRLASFLMACLFLAAVLCYAAGLARERQLAARRPAAEQARPDEYEDEPWAGPAVAEAAYEDDGPG